MFIKLLEIVSFHRFCSFMCINYVDLDWKHFLHILAESLASLGSARAWHHATRNIYYSYYYSYDSVSLFNSTTKKLSIYSTIYNLISFVRLSVRLFS